jgi:hypothetical protein
VPHFILVPMPATRLTRSAGERRLLRSMAAALGPNWLALPGAGKACERFAAADCAGPEEFGFLTRRQQNPPSTVSTRRRYLVEIPILRGLERSIVKNS